MDNYIVSARKYRPMTFRSVVGQHALTTTLKNAIHSNKLAHAYLFCGPRGVGKTSCARIFAKTINCLNPTSEGESCNACESCQAFNEQRSYNIHELDAASNNSVEDIRSLIDQVRIPPPIGKYKVFIIDEVHMLSTAAFNAFLKTLEEPPHHAVFILATTEKHKVLPTILSRCQTYDFSRISVADIVEHLQYVASQEGVEAEAEALNVIAQKADGGMRDALSIFDQVASFTNGNITYEAVINNLNVLDYEYYFRFTDAILSGNVRTALLILNDILSKGFDGQHVITGLASHFRDLLVCRDESTLVLFEVGASIRERYKTMAKRCPDELLFKAIELANTCDLNYKASRNKRLLLELTLIQLCQLVQNPSDSKKKILIEPITTEAPASHQTVQPQPSSRPTASQQPQPTTPTAPSRKTASKPDDINLPPKTTSASRKPNRPKGLSIKGSGTDKQDTTSTQPTIETPKEEVITPFTNESLIQEWKNYANTLKEQVHLKNSMLNTKPILQEDYSFIVDVLNIPLKDELQKDTPNILTYLRERLHNSQISMHIRVVESSDKQKAYTDPDKYKLLLQLNPNLEILRKEFSLTFD